MLISTLLNCWRKGKQLLEFLDTVSTLQVATYHSHQIYTLIFLSTDHFCLVAYPQLPESWLSLLRCSQALRARSKLSLFSVILCGLHSNAEQWMNHAWPWPCSSSKFCPLGMLRIFQRLQKFLVMLLQTELEHFWIWLGLWKTDFWREKGSLPNKRQRKNNVG